MPNNTTNHAITYTNREEEHPRSVHKGATPPLPTPGKWPSVLSATSVYLVVQFYPWFKFYFPLFWGMVMYDNEFKTKENKI